MKKLLLVILLVVSFNVFGRDKIDSLPITQNIGSGSTLVRVPPNGALRAYLINNWFYDTAAANNTSIKEYAFAQIGTFSDGNVWVRNIYGTGWILMAGGGGVSPSGSFWSLTGNYMSVIPSGFGIGTNSPDNLPFKTDNTTRAYIPAAGFVRSNDTTNTKIFTLNPSTGQWGYANWNNGGGGGSTPTWQQVTDAGNTTTNRLGVNLTSGIIGKLHIRTDGIETTQTDSTGIYLENSTASTNGVPVQYSPPLVFKGTAKAMIGSSQTQVWRLFNKPSNSLGGTSSKFVFDVNVNGGGYNTIAELSSTSGLTLLDPANASVKGIINGLRFENNGSFFVAGSTTTASLTASGSTGNTGLGINVLNSLSTGASYNTAVGEEAITGDTSGSYNTGVGYRALKGLKNGYSNTAVGVNSGVAITTGFQNTFVGAGSAENTTTGQENVFVGYDAGLNNTTGIRNVYVGWNAKAGPKSIHNVAVGYLAGASMTDSTSNNVIIGESAAYNGSQKTNMIGSVVIGADTYSTKDSVVVLGADYIKETHLKGNVGIGTTSPAATLHVAGSSGSTLRIVDGNQGAGKILVSDADGDASWSASLPSGLVPTWQQTLTAGSTLNTDNSVDGGGFDFQLTNNNSVYLRSLNTNDYGSLYLTASSAELNGQTTGARNSRVTAFGDSILLQPYLGAISIDTLQAASSQNTLMGWTSTSGANRGKVGSVTIGTGLSLSSGTLSSSGISGSGTTSYIPIFTGSTSVGNSNVYQDGSGNIGIGTTSPAQKLHVYTSGSGSVTQMKIEQGNNYYTAFYQDWGNSVWYTNSNIYARVNGQYGKTWLYVEPSGANVNINHDNNDMDFDVKGTTDNSLIYADASTDKVAIGRNNPTTKLQVAGRFASEQGADIASANNLTLGSDGNIFEVTGTTQINLINATGWVNGSIVILYLQSGITVKHGQTTSGSNTKILLDGALDFAPSGPAALTLVLGEVGGTQCWREVSRSNY